MSTTEQDQQLQATAMQQKAEENKKDYRKPSLAQLGKIEALTQGQPTFGLS